MDLLAPAGPRKPRQGRIYGTAFDISAFNLELVTNDLMDRFGTSEFRIQLGSRKCVDLFKDFERGLSPFW